MASPPTGPLYGWQTAPPHELAVAIAARSQQLDDAGVPATTAEREALDSRITHGSWGSSAELCSTMISGFGAASYVGYSTSEHLLLLDRSDAFAEVVTAWSDQNRVNISGTVPAVSSSATANLVPKVMDAAQKGESVTIFAPAEQVDELLPAVIQLGDAKAPCTIFVAAAADGAMDEASTLRSSDCPLLWASTPQECHDSAIVAAAYSIANRTPVIVIFDGDHTGQAIAEVKMCSPMWVERYISTLGSDLPQADGSILSVLESSASSFVGTSCVGSGASSASGEQAQVQLFKLMAGFQLDPIEYIGSANAATVIIGFGPGSIAVPAAIHGSEGPAATSVGYLRVRALRPWSTAELANKIPRSATSVVVLDASTGMFEDVSVSLSEIGSGAPLLYHAIPTEMSGGFTPRHAKAIVAMATALPEVGTTLTVKPELSASEQLVDASTFNRTEVIRGVFWKISPARQVLQEAVTLAGAFVDTSALHGVRARVTASKDATPGTISTRTELSIATSEANDAALAAESALTDVQYVSFGHSSLLLMPNYELLPVAFGGVVVINCTWSRDEAEVLIPASLKRQIADLGLRLYVVDADAITKRFAGCSTADELLQALFWPLCTALEPPNTIASKFDGRLSTVVSELKQYEYTSAWGQCPVPVRTPPRFVALRVPHAEMDSSPVREYSVMLTELFGSSSIIADSTSTESLFGGRYSPSTAVEDVNSVFEQADGRGEVSLGVHMARFAIRKQLVQNVAAYIKGAVAAEAAPTDLTTALGQWYENKDNGPASRALGESVVSLLQSQQERSTELTAIADAAQYFAKPSKWILGGDSWAFDISFSGIHHIMASGEDINVLVFDTTLQSKVAQIARETGRTRKDIGLYAMNYGDCFVASTAASFSRTQAARSLLEADAFKGPSIVLAYTPIVTIDAQTTSVAEVAGAVDAGTWPLYRWDPSKTHPFELDSAKLRADVEAFVKRDTDLSLVYEHEVAADLELTASLEDSLAEHQALLLSTSMTANAVPVKKIELSLIIAFGSDNSNGMGVAERMAALAEVRNVREVKCVEANTLSVDDVKQCDVVLFVISTAGQGEMCGNSKTFWSAINKVKALPSSVRYGIFGLGDSAYWGKGTADSLRYFCKPALDLDKVLDGAGANKLAEVGLGDDQHENGYEGALAPWQNEVFDKLGIHKVAGEDDGKPGLWPSDDGLKVDSNYLRGDILRSLADTSTGKILPEDAKLTKFHGIYQQDNRDVRAGLEDAGKERAYSFMIRVGIPGGVCEPHQMLRMIALADSHANGFLKLTTRQAFQVHGVIKHRLKPTMQEINKGLMDTLAACGDVCRNVIASPMPVDQTVHAEVLEFSRRIQTHLKPQTAAYHEIWMDKKMVNGNANAEVEPLYGPTYLPRKFKIAIAVPPQNDVDVFSHCLGYIAIVVNGKLLGYNVTAGGGMGMTHGNTKTFPRLADILGFCSPDQAIKVGEAVMLVQRDHGERNNRKHARLKYTMDDHGVEWYRTEVEKRCSFKLGKPRPFKFTSNGDRHGWVQGQGGKFHYGIYVEHGRVRDTETVKMRTGLEEIAKVHKGDFRLTANQQCIIGNVDGKDLEQIAALLQKYNIDSGKYSELRLNSMACEALPTCALAMAESARYLPSLMTKIEAILEKNGLFKTPITIRMTGCPNGCARPYMAEIAFVGKAPGHYNMYFGGGFAGNRLTKLYRESVNEAQILEIIEPILVDYAQSRIGEERFGDFVIRRGIVEPCLSGNTFHETEKEKIHAVKTFSGTNDIYW